MKNKIILTPPIRARLIMFGTGTSQNAPSIGALLTKSTVTGALSTNPLDHRLNVHGYIEFNKGVQKDAFLIDMPPVFPVAIKRAVMGRGVFGQVSMPENSTSGFFNALHKISTILYTHNHFDHIGGTDFLRDLQSVLGRLITLYGQPPVFDKIKRISAEHCVPQRIEFNLFEDWKPQLLNINRRHNLKGMSESFLDPQVLDNILANGLVPVTQEINVQFIQRAIYKYYDANIAALQSINRVKYSKQINALKKKRSTILSISSEDWLNNPGHVLAKKYRMKLELVFPSKLVSPRVIMPVRIKKAKGKIERTDKHGKVTLFKDIRYWYAPQFVGNLGIQVIPLDIKHGPDWEKLNQDPLRSGPLGVTKTIRHDPQLPNSILGYLFPEFKFAYVTDACHVPEHTVKLLKEARLDHFIINGLWVKDKHISHMSMEEAMGIALEVNAKKVFIVHAASEIRIEETNRQLAEMLDQKKKKYPNSQVESVELAFDGLAIELN